MNGSLSAVQVHHQNMLKRTRRRSSTTIPSPLTPPRDTAGTHAKAVSGSALPSHRSNTSRDYGSDSSLEHDHAVAHHLHHAPYLGPACMSAVSRMEVKIPSRRGSLENLLHLDPTGEPAHLEDAPPSHVLASTAPPPRLSRRATLSNASTPPSTGRTASAGASLGPHTAPHPLLAPRRPTVSPQSATLEETRGRRTSDFKANSSRQRSCSTSLELQQLQLSASGLSGRNEPSVSSTGNSYNGGSCNGGSYNSSHNSSSTSHPHGIITAGSAVVPMRSRAAAAAAQGGDNHIGRHVSAPQEREAILVPAEVRLNKKLKPLFTSAATRRRSKSPLVVHPRRLSRSSCDSADSPTTPPTEALQLDSVLRCSRSNSVGSPMVSPPLPQRRVHFSLDGGSAESTSTASSVRGNVEDMYGLPSFVRPTNNALVIDTTPLQLELVNHGSPESSARLSLSLSSSSRMSAETGDVTSPLSAKVGGLPASAHAGGNPVLCLRLHRKAGRFEATPVINVTRGAAGAARAASGTSTVDPNAWSKHILGLPMPKPALKPYSRYSDDSHSSGSSSDIPTRLGGKREGHRPEDKGDGNGKLACTLRWMRGEIRGALARQPERRRAQHSTGDGADTAEPGVAVRGGNTPVNAWVKWLLLIITAVLSFVFVLVATIVD